MKSAKNVYPLLLFVSQFVNAQTGTISGIVSNPQGNPLHFAFVQDKHNKNGTYTDSLGNFTLDVNPGSKLRVDCAGYNDTVINVDHKSNFTIVLNVNPGYIAANGETSAAANDNIAQSTFRDQINYSQPGSQVDGAAGAIIPVFSLKDETKGSRYFFNGWVHGTVINSKDSLIQNPAFLFNYDKIHGGLLLTQDRKTAIEVNRENIKSFTLYNEKNDRFTFENVPAIDNMHYAEVLTDGKKYKIYKLIKTQFNKADFSTNGLTTSGNNYDEYADEAVYYLLNVKSNQLQKFTLKRKSIAQSFPQDAEKVNKFILDHSSDTIDDTYLAGLGMVLNN